MKKFKSILKKMSALLMATVILCSFAAVPASATGAGVGGTGNGGDKISLADPGTFDAEETFNKTLGVIFNVVTALGILAVVVAFVMMVKELSFSKENRDFTKTMTCGIAGLIMATLPTILKSVGLLA